MGKPSKSRARPRKRPTTNASAPGASAPYQGRREQLASPLERAWVESRSGAIAGRGYHYQDLVGAWVALRVLVGEIAPGRVLPEAFDDLTCESSPPQQVQVKSRQERVGEFRTAEVARFVVEAWQRALKGRPDGGPEDASEEYAAGSKVTGTAADDAAELASIVVVLERAVDGHAPREWAQAISDDDKLDELAASSRARAATAGIDAQVVDVLVERTSIVVLPQQDLLSEAAQHLASRTGLPLAATVPIIQALRSAIAEHSDRNAEVSLEQRAGLSRTDVGRIVSDAAALVDRESLEAAVSSGAAQPVVFDTALPDRDFYSGTSTQPGHIVEGLVTPRPTLTDEVLTALGSGRPVLVAGPSGIGKSALMWMAAFVARHAVWYRVHRLNEDDVEPLIRLAVASGAGRYGPVGFIVDGIGTGALSAWDDLLQRASATAGVLLLGSVREEDMPRLRSLAQCVVVRPRLDEELAARIHQGLRDNGSTTQPHWREAYEHSNGLTLEFTHLLTKGRRLGDVVADQVNERVRSQRSTELAVLAPVSIAHRWGAALSLASVGELVPVAAGELKEALTRLVSEHLLTMIDGLVSGLHPVRSAALSKAVHDVPPPLLAHTVAQVIGAVGVEHLHSFVAQAVADYPGLGPVVLDALADRFDVSPEPQVVAAAGLGGLRLADFVLLARRWVTILEQNEVPAPLRPLALDLGLMDGDLLDSFDDRLLAAVRAIRADRSATSSHLRDELVARMGTARVNDLVHDAVDLAVAETLLSCMSGTGVEISPVPPQAPLHAALQDAPLTRVGDLVCAASGVSAASAAVIADAAGGEDTLLARLLQSHPWALELNVEADGGERVLRGRVLHVHDRHNAEPGSRIKELADIGLRCLPDVARADLSTVLTGGGTYQYGGYQMGDSGLLRQYVRDESTIAWNRERSRFARSLVATQSTTERLSAGLEVLHATADFLANLTDAWVTDRGTGQRLTALNLQQTTLTRQIDELIPEQAADPLSGPRGVSTAQGNDPIHGVTQGVVHHLAPRLGDSSKYASLAAFAGDNIVRRVHDARDEPWGLLGLDGAPPVLDRLEVALRQFAQVLMELAVGDTTAAHIVGATRSLPRGRALARAARLADARAQRRYAETLAAVAAGAAARGLRVEVRSRPDPDADTWIWPPVATAVVAHVDGPTGIGASIAALSDILNEVSVPGSTMVVIPVQSGVPLLRYTQRLSQSGKVYPLPQEADVWLDQVPPARLMPCSDAVADAVDALTELSALAWFDTQRPDGPLIHEAVAAAQEAFLDAMGRLDSLASDDVIGVLQYELEMLARRVQHESDTRATEGVLAEGIASAFGGQPDDVLYQSEGLLAIATQWDLSPEAAHAFLEEIADTDETAEERTEPQSR